MFRTINFLKNSRLLLVVIVTACSATTPELPSVPSEIPPVVIESPTGIEPTLPSIRDSSPIPSTTRINYVAQGLASWYPAFAHGKKTASGEIYDLYGMTAAHATLPLLSWALVRNLSTGERVIVKINDRLTEGNTLIQLSYEAAQRLNLFNQTPRVEVIAVAPPHSRLSELRTNYHVFTK